MKFCALNKRYLRPTFICNHHESEIIAMAHKLGAFQKTDFEYAETVYKFVNMNVRIDFSPPKSAVECLRRGHGTCIDKLNLFLALCRVAGIKDRYRLYSFQGLEELYDIYVAADPLEKNGLMSSIFLCYMEVVRFLLMGNGKSVMYLLIFIMLLLKRFQFRILRGSSRSLDQTSTWCLETKEVAYWF